MNAEWPVFFEINTQEQLDIIHCAMSEFKDSDEETQWQADCLSIRLDVIRKKQIQADERLRHEA